MRQANWLMVQIGDRHNSILRADVLRLPLGILTGVGFIGGGVILRRGEMVRGITSASPIWLLTVIGLCFGGGSSGLALSRSQRAAVRRPSCDADDQACGGRCGDA